MASLISPCSLAPSLSLFLFLFLFLFFLSFAEDGRSLYLKHCANCHHEDRIGKTAPPLIPQLLRNKTDRELKRIVRSGVPATGMPAFPHLKEEQLSALISYIKSPLEKVSYGLEEIKDSYRIVRTGNKRLKVASPEHLTVTVDKGEGTVVLISGQKVIDSFPMKNVHGGVKFSLRGDKFYVPARDGWVFLYSLSEGGAISKVRACLYLRNISILNEEGVLAVSCTLPSRLILLDLSLKPIKSIELPGRPSAVYSLNKRGVFVLTFRDKPLLAFVRPDGAVDIHKLKTPVGDFFIDPLEKALIGSSRSHSLLFIYSLENLSELARFKVGSMPHLFSASFWYSEGNFYFATRHINTSTVSVWKMYDWKHIKDIDVGGRGFFVRSSPGVPYLWVDTGDGYFTMVDKKTLRVRREKISGGGVLTHVEFSPDGRFAYLSLVGQEHGLKIYNPLTLKKMADIPMKHPAGKYNFLLKSRAYYPSLLGREVFMTKCWGCHHYTKEAFGPSMKWISANRSNEEIVSQLLNPQATAPLLGYKRNAMPKIKLSQEEIEVLLALIESFKGGGKRDAKGE